MKFKNTIASLAIGLITLSTAASAETWVSIGKGPKSEGGGTSLAIGFKGASNWGFALGGVFNSEYSSSDVLNYPVPHNNYTVLDEKRVDNSLGFDALYFIDASETVKPYVGLGLYTNNKKTLARSNSTGWIYTQHDTSGVVVSGEVGLQAKTASGLVFGIGFHNIRGASLSIGKQF